MKFEGRSALRYKSIGKRSLGRPRNIWEDYIRINLKGIGVSTRNWTNLVQDRDHWRAFVNFVLGHGVSYKVRIYKLTHF